MAKSKEERNKLFIADWKKKDSLGYFKGSPGKISKK